MLTQTDRVGFRGIYIEHCVGGDVPKFPALVSGQRWLPVLRTYVQIGDAAAVVAAAAAVVDDAVNNSSVGDFSPLTVATLGMDVAA